MTRDASYADARLVCKARTKTRQLQAEMCGTEGTVLAQEGEQLRGREKKKKHEGYLGPTLNEEY